MQCLLGSAWDRHDLGNPGSRPLHSISAKTELPKTIQIEYRMVVTWEAFQVRERIVHIYIYVYTHIFCLFVLLLLWLILINIYFLYIYIYIYRRLGGWKRVSQRRTGKSFRFAACEWARRSCGIGWEQLCLPRWAWRIEFVRLCQSVRFPLEVFVRAVRRLTDVMWSLCCSECF